MPIYEYTCKKCGVFEVTQRITEDPLKRCPTCGGKVNKLISLSSFQLKGSGWYLTDYARSNGKKGDSGEKKEEAKATEGGKEAPSGKKEGASKEAPSSASS